MPEPTKDNLIEYFPQDPSGATFKRKTPHQRARLVRIAQIRYEMARVYNYMLRGFNAPYVLLMEHDPIELRRQYPEGFTLTAEQAKACTMVLKEIAALVHTQAIEAKLDMLKDNIKRIISEQGLPIPEFLEEKPETESAADGEWASEQIEAEEPGEVLIEMEKDEG